MRASVGFAPALLMAQLWAAACARDSVAPYQPVLPGLERAPAADAGTVTPASTPTVDGGAEVAVPPADASAAGCDLGGRWLVAQRVLAVALGAQQAAHNWFYYELEQRGAALVVKKGLHCGFDVLRLSSLGASVDSQAAWPAFLQHNSSTGRTGTVVAEAGGCHLRLDREYVVRGATISRYADPAVPMPDRSQPAMGTTPGWEDWDGDGNPGVSYKVSSSLASGTVYVCQRDWTEYDGPIVSGPKFKVAIRYGAEQIALGRSEGASVLLESAAAPASAPDEHRAWFYRLQPGQAVGSDAEICAAIRALRPSLVPEAGD